MTFLEVTPDGWGASSVVHSRTGTFDSHPKRLAQAFLVVDPCGQRPCPAFRRDLIQEELELLNQLRRGVGSSPVSVDDRLVACAEWKALNMGAFMYMQHDDPDPAYPGGRTVIERFAAFYPTMAAWGENIAYGILTPAAVINAFQGDEAHKQNMLSPAWKSVGLAVVQAANGLLFWVQDFGSLSPLTPPPPPVPSGSVLQRWMTEVLPKIQATSQYTTWRAKPTSAADVARWDAYLANPHSSMPAMKTPYGKFLASDLHLAATS